jgi:hypothetical protein
MLAGDEFIQYDSIVAEFSVSHRERAGVRVSLKRTTLTSSSPSSGGRGKRSSVHSGCQPTP